MHFIVVSLQLQQMNHRQLVFAALLENQSMIYDIWLRERKQAVIKTVTSLK